MGPFPDLELGGPKELSVGLGRQDARHPQGLLAGLLTNEVRQALGFRFLFRSEKRLGHAWLPVGMRGGFSKPVDIRHYGTKNPPTFQLPTHRLSRNRFFLPVA